MNCQMKVPQPLFSRSFGEGARQVLAFHCTIAHSGAWRGVASELEQEATFHCPDMLCHGRSPDWDGRGDFSDRMAEAVAGHLTDRMDVVGHSFGATVALRLAVEHPDKVRSLTLIEPVLFSVAVLDRPELVDLQTEKNRPFHEAILAGEYEAAARIFNRGWGDGDGPRWTDLPEHSRQAMTRGVRIVPACNTVVTQDRPGLMKPESLARVTMPVLLMRGSTTEEIIGVVNDGLAARLPQARNVVVEGAGHMLPVSHPVETARELKSLFETAPA
ncbi:alpha/beta fold hydrolase [Albibacillus kandeliae]|uniref:alpha/beta fold hydrolase n=1 Tax=Albibacillus kandeliae TaxID=2174228 RepID=UPI001E563D6D|nr:alpha/beta hydrolase [Albibacillus kandeliae]